SSRGDPEARPDLVAGRATMELAQDGHLALRRRPRRGPGGVDARRRERRPAGGDGPDRAQDLADLGALVEEPERAALEGGAHDRRSAERGQDDHPTTG